jgi:hypothetical protein
MTSSVSFQDRRSLEANPIAFSNKPTRLVFAKVPDSSPLLELLRAIAARDAKASLRRLEQSERLACEALKVGASRQDPQSYFLEPIAHYVYAGDTALHVAAAAYQLDVAKALLKLGASASARNRRGAEPLHYAADGAPGSAWWDPEAQAGVIRLLIEAGAKPNVLDKSGVAPLHRAVRTRSTGAVEALLAVGADPRLKNKSGSTPIQLAGLDSGRGGSGSLQARAEQAKILKLLGA